MGRAERPSKTGISAPPTRAFLHIIIMRVTMQKGGEREAKEGRRDFCI